MENPTEAINALLNKGIRHNTPSTDGPYLPDCLKTLQASARSYVAQARSKV